MIDIFISYAYHDSNLRSELEKHLSPLKRMGHIRNWTDGLIRPGGTWEAEIHHRLTNSQIILLLISPDFVNSDFCYHKEMWKAIQLHIDKKARIIPIILRPVLWETLPFHFLQALPAQGRPITLWEDRDAAFLDVAQGIASVVRELTPQDETVNPEFNQRWMAPKTPLENLSGLLEVGHSYPVTVSRAISAIVNAADSPNLDYDSAETQLYSFVTDCFVGHGGIELQRSKNVQDFIYWGESRCDQAALAGAHLLDTVPAFFRASQVQIEIYVLAHDTTLDFSGSISDAPGQDILAAIEPACVSGEYCVTEAVRSALSTHLRNSFYYKRKTEDVAIFSYSREPLGVNTVIKDIEVLAAQAPSKREQLSHLIQFASRDKKQTRIEVVRSLLDDFYLNIERSRSLAMRATNDWASGDLHKLGSLLEVILSNEQLLWSNFSRLDKRPLGKEWAIISKLFASRRSYTITILSALTEQIAAECTAFAVPSTGFSDIRETSASPQEILFESLEQLARSDDLEKETLFSSLIHEQRQTLVLSLQDASIVDVRNQGLDSLWQFTDLILIEDSAEVHRGKKGSERIFPLLVKREKTPERFTNLALALADTSHSTLRIIEKVFTTPEDREIALKCIMIEHSDQDERRAAAQAVPFESLWRIAAYPRAPMTVILDIARRLSGEEHDDVKKIFFDSVRGNIVNLLDMQRPRALDAARGLLDLFFSFGFFVEDLYFERLDDLLFRFIEANRRLGNYLDYFAEPKAQLDYRREASGNPKATNPSETHLKRVPLAVQRKLARDGYYMDFFVIHPDARIARETMRHIKPHDISRILSYRNINNTLLLELLPERRFFRTDDNIEAALNNPKCNIRFAHLFLSSRSLTQLKRIAFNVNANVHIRQLALKEAVNRPNCDSDFARTMLGKLSLSDLSNLIGNPRSNPQVRIVAREILRSR